MPRRSSPEAIRNVDDLSALQAVIVDKRAGKRAHAKRSRRNRHYERQFLRHSVTRWRVEDGDPRG
jgi:hypothetical protein